MVDISQPKVSLLVPIYNVERYLQQCLDSAQNQTLQDIEVICINDGSTDSSRDIIQTYLDADSRFKVIDKPNSGYGASMNQGLDAAQGEYIGILESDDFFELDALEKLYAAAKTNKADVVKADFDLYWSTPEEKHERFNFVREGEAGVTVPLDAVQVFYRKPSIWSAIYSRNFLDKNHIRFLETPGASYQDTSFNFKIWACAETIVLIDEVILHYRQDNESSSINAPGKVYCVCDEYEEMVRFLQFSEKREALNPILVKMRYDSYMWNYERLTEPLQRQFVNRMAEDFAYEDSHGLTDYSLFYEPWKVADRKAIISNPQAFHASQIQKGRQINNNSKLHTIKRLFHDGGLGLVLKTVKEKLFGKK